MNEIVKITVKSMRRLARRFFAAPFLTATLVALYCVRPVISVKVLLINEFRIGELVGATDLYLRRQDLGMIPKQKGLVFAVIGSPCNRQLINMYRRRFQIIQSQILLYMVKHPILRNSPFVERLYFGDYNEYHEFNNIGAPIAFTAEEEMEGQRLLRFMGIPEGAWYVCFHARDTAYLRDRIPTRDMSHTDVRNASIEHCFEAMKFVASQGGYAIRMGSAVNDPIADLGSPRIIDYASNYREDFGDIYLLANCRFLVASGGGLSQVAYAFNVPVVNTNVLCMGTVAPYGKKDLFLSKPIWSRPLGRFLTLPEILGSEACFSTLRDYFDEAQLDVGESSSEDILGVTCEMLERLDEKFVPVDDDEELLNKFKALLTPEHAAYNMPGRISATYLNAHRELLEPVEI